MATSVTPSLLGASGTSARSSLPHQPVGPNASARFTVPRHYVGLRGLALLVAPERVEALLVELPDAAEIGVVEEGPPRIYVL